MKGAPLLTPPNPSKPYPQTQEGGKHTDNHNVNLGLKSSRAASATRAAGERQHAPPGGDDAQATWRNERTALAAELDAARRDAESALARSGAVTEDLQHGARVEVRKSKENAAWRATCTRRVLGWQTRADGWAPPLEAVCAVRAGRAGRRREGDVDAARGRGAKG